MISVLGLLTIGAVPLSAQNSGPVMDASLRMTLVTDPQQIRFTTTEAIDWRLEITDSQGQLLFDTGFAVSNSLVWPLLDAQGQAVASGMYRYAVSIRGRQGSRSQRGELSVERISSIYQVTATSEPSGEGTSLTVVAAESGATSTAAIPGLPTHLGRVTFGTLQPYISGTGTTNTITKWADGPGGVVGDTAVNEYAGAVTIGNGSFYGTLHIFGSEGSDVFAGMGPNLATGPAFNFGYAGGSFGRSAGFFNVRPDASATPPNPSLRFLTGNQQRMMITNTGNVGIGTTNPTARLHVQGFGTGFGEAFRVTSSTGAFGVDVLDNGQVVFYNVPIGSFSTGHLCRDSGYLRHCVGSSEHVPTVAKMQGFPQTGELVSILTEAANPYGDDHAPFVVAKSSTPCDENLLGVIVNPESGADGKKVNDHYLPLTIYGYFPAKVTMENGRIRRGDAISSSSTPGQGMKALGACKVVGYALEDADTDKTIQVFANLSRSAGPDVTAPPGQVAALTQENVELKQALAKLEARLAAIEQAKRPAGQK